jgi:hypothetical protein
MYTVQNSDPDWYKDFLEKRQKIEETIIQQYTQCTKLLNELFSFAPDQCYREDKVGCCAGGGYSEDGFNGPAEITLLRMREKILAKEGWEAGVKCQYHRNDRGCILGELKAPRCIGQYCEGGLLKYGYDEMHVRDLLGKILAGLDSKDEINPEENWSVVKELEDYVKGFMEKIKSKEQVSNKTNNSKS